MIVVRAWISPTNRLHTSASTRVRVKEKAACPNKSTKSTTSIGPVTTKRRNDHQRPGDLD